MRHQVVVDMHCKQEHGAVVHSRGHATQALYRVLGGYRTRHSMRHGWILKWAGHFDLKRIYCGANIPLRNPDVMVMVMVLNSACTGPVP